jgi:hypothetical protein
VDAAMARNIALSGPDLVLPAFFLRLMRYGQAYWCNCLFLNIALSVRESDLHWVIHGGCGGLSFFCDAANLWAFGSLRC